MLLRFDFPKWPCNVLRCEVGPVQAPDSPAAEDGNRLLGSAILMLARHCVLSGTLPKTNHEACRYLLLSGSCFGCGLLGSLMYSYHPRPCAVQELRYARLQKRMIHRLAQLIEHGLQRVMDTNMPPPGLQDASTSCTLARRPSTAF